MQRLRPFSKTVACQPIMLYRKSKYQQEMQIRQRRIEAASQRPDLSLLSMVAPPLWI